MLCRTHGARNVDVQLLNPPKFERIIERYLSWFVDKQTAHLIMSYMYQTRKFIVFVHLDHELDLQLSYQEKDHNLSFAY